MEYLKRLLPKLLREVADNIEEGCDIADDELSALIDCVEVLSPTRPFSKVQACDYLHMSRSNFDNYIRLGVIPEGLKAKGFKELSWRKMDLDKCKVKLKELKSKESSK